MTIFISSLIFKQTMWFGDTFMSYGLVSILGLPTQECRSRSMWTFKIKIVTT